MNNPLAMMQNLTSNPLFQQAQKMANGKNSEEIQEIAKNICKSRGINFDEALAQFKQMMKGF